MKTVEHNRYRGYDIVPMRQWSQWCVGIYPTRASRLGTTPPYPSRLPAQ